MEPTVICWDWWVSPIVRWRRCSLQPRPVWGTKDVFDRALRGSCRFECSQSNEYRVFPNWSEPGGELSVFIDEREFGRIAVADLLP